MRAGLAVPVPCHSRLFFGLDVLGFQTQVPDSQSVILLAGPAADEETPLSVDRHSRHDGYRTEVSTGKRFQRRLRVQVPPSDFRDHAGDDAVVAWVNAYRVDRVGLGSFFTLELADKDRFFDVELADEAV